MAPVIVPNHHLLNDDNDGYLLRLYNISSVDVFDNALFCKLYDEYLCIPQKKGITFS
jgi:hypothetical protein